MESLRPVVHPQRGREEKNLPFANMHAENNNNNNHQKPTKKKKNPNRPTSQKPRCLPLLGAGRQIPQRFGSVAVPFFMKCSAQPVLFAFFH